MDRKVILLILDGWGYRKENEHNAVKLSNPVNFDYLVENYPNMLINASEEYVGLPKGQMGNSEVGHTNIGAGRVVYQDLVRIEKAIESETIKGNRKLFEFIDRLKANGGSVHFLVF